MLCAIYGWIVVACEDHRKKQGLVRQRRENRLVCRFAHFKCKSACRLRFGNLTRCSIGTQQTAAVFGAANLGPVIQIKAIGGLLEAGGRNSARRDQHMIVQCQEEVVVILNRLLLTGVDPMSTDTLARH